MTPADHRAALRAGEAHEGTSQFGSTTVRVDEPTPILGTALHHSHYIREELVGKLEISDAERYYEEDPETHRFIGSLLHTLMPTQSRYEMDLNRSPDVTIYARPELAWGKTVWREPLTQQETEHTLERWYEFHQLLDASVEDAIERFGIAVVFDIHSYNYQREQTVDWRTDDKPCINLGTKHLQMDERSRALKDLVLSELEGHTLLGEPMLVQENAVFNGGYMNRRLSRRFGPQCLTLSVEYKKVFMDEREGKVLDEELDDLVRQLHDTVHVLADKMDAPVRDKPIVPTCATS